MANYSMLFSPVKVGRLTFKNRIFASPISLFDLVPGKQYLPSAKDIDFYRLRAMGGAALVTVGDSAVHPSGLAPDNHKLLLNTPDIIPFLTDITDEIHKYGAFASIELNHGGIRTAREDNLGHGPDETVSDKGFRIAAMSREEIIEVADSFGVSARNCQLAGFDMVTLHAGHGWLLGNFLSPLTNHRTDEFGGSAENRARFTLLAVEAVRRYCGTEFPIEVRFSGSEVTPGGMTLEDGVEFAKLLDGKVELLHVSAGTLVVPETEVITHPSQFLPHGCNAYLAAEIKKHVKTPVVTVGSHSDPAAMEAILRRGDADIIAVGRALIADPYLPRKARDGRQDEIRPCLRCLNCLGYCDLTAVVRCSVNPDIGFESALFAPEPPYDRKRVVIAGGGAAGMQCAITAAGRGHEVILFEKNLQLGGLIRYSRNVPFKADLSAFLDYLIAQLGSCGAEVQLGTELTAELAAQLRPDVLILAVGSLPAVPPIPGAASAVSITQLYDADTRLGHRVAVIGGGLAGCEAAIELADRGHEVTVIEMRGDWAVDANEMHKVAMETQLRGRVNILLNARCNAIDELGVHCKTDEGDVTVPADSVVMAAGMTANDKAADALYIAGLETVRIGDCRKTGMVRDAVRTGYDAARAIGLKY